MPPRKKSKNPVTYEEVGPFSVMRKPILSEDGKKFMLDVTTETGDNSQHACSKEIYKEIMGDQLYKNYRFHFLMHRNSSTGDIERISTSPKDIYESYTVEYEDSMKVPDKDLDKAPA